MRDNICSWILPCRSNFINLLKLFVSMALNATLKHRIKYDDINLVFIKSSCNEVKNIPSLAKLFLMRRFITFNQRSQNHNIRSQIINEL